MKLNQESLEKLLIACSQLKNEDGLLLCKMEKEVLTPMVLEQIPESLRKILLA